jgi:hypothetical protein
MPRASARPIAGTHNPRIHASKPATSVAAPQVSSSHITTIPRTHPARRADHRQFGVALQRMIAAGQRPCVRVVVFGIDGVFVQLAVYGMPGAIARTRTRRRAREIARATVASILDLDPLAFDLEVVGA